MSELAMVNAVAMAAVVAALMLAIFALRRQLGARWIVWNFEALLLTVLLRRVDEIGLRFGVDLLDHTANLLLSWAVVIILCVSFAKAWLRRAEIKRVEAGRQARVEYLETLRQNAERGRSWDRQW